jgi:hypothetical protein
MNDIQEDPSRCDDHRCTWEGCVADATHPQLDKAGHIWAQLCNEHHNELDAALEALSVKATLRAWVKAQGGAKAAARRVQ